MHSSFADRHPILAATGAAATLTPGATTTSGWAHLRAWAAAGSVVRRDTHLREDARLPPLAAAAPAISPLVRAWLR